MTETKRRGRPTNEERAAREAALLRPSEPQPLQDEAKERAQAYALKIWNGQSPSLGRAVRVERVKSALAGQGMSFDGVRLPGDVSDDDWTDEDEAPITWRKPGAA